ncbi:hypothetical protein BI343_02300 [Chromobacterium amazonense]|nr:hypothetical protein BI343_02300 [Chromobacterium amazonense]
MQVPSCRLPKLFLSFDNGLALLAQHALPRYSMSRTTRIARQSRRILRRAPHHSHLPIFAIRYKAGMVFSWLPGHFQACAHALVGTLQLGSIMDNRLPYASIAQSQWEGWIGHGAHQRHALFMRSHVGRVANLRAMLHGMVRAAAQRTALVFGRHSGIQHAADEAFGLAAAGHGMRATAKTEHVVQIVVAGIHLLLPLRAGPQQLGAATQGFSVSHVNREIEMIGVYALNLLPQRFHSLIGSIAQRV